MNNYNKRILLSVTGMSPAVVTETLYALVTEKGFIPTEIQVITTEQGKNKLLQTLLGIQGGRKESKGALQEFIEDYGKQYDFSSIHFDESCIHIIKDKCGQNLPDIRTPEENEQAANSIIQLVGKLCQDEESQLHVSIAGGRKTMGFFMGYALSLYGREQDSLSHVLVDGQYENLPSFYYPKPYPYLINKNDGTQLDAKDGKIMLAEIPWVRLGLGVPEGLINNEISYGDSVRKAQKLLEEPQLTFLSPIDDKKVLFGDEEISLEARAYAFLLSLTLSKLQGWDYVNIVRANNNGKQVVKTYLNVYETLVVQDEKSTNNMRRRLEKEDDLTRVLSESCDRLKKQVRKALSINYTKKHPYLPAAPKGIYQLLIDKEQLDISEIKNDLQHLSVI